MSRDLPSIEVMKALAAMAIGTHFSIFADDSMGVQVRADKWVRVGGAELAELVERGWVEVSDDDRRTESGETVPKSIVVTDRGRYWLRRYQEINKCTIRLA